MFLPKGALISGDAGHNCNPDKGATGLLSEEGCTKNIWNLIMKKLENLGYRTEDCTPWNIEFNSIGSSLKYRVKKANNSKSIIHLSIHFNAEDLEGVRCFVGDFKWDAEKIATQICEEISNLGFKNNGVKNGEVYMLRYTDMPCILIECASINAKEDIEFYNEENIANAIVKAIMEFAN